MEERTVGQIRRQQSISVQDLYIQHRKVRGRIQEFTERHRQFMLGSVSYTERTEVHQMRSEPQKERVMKTVYSGKRRTWGEQSRSVRVGCKDPRGALVIYICVYLYIYIYIYLQIDIYRQTQIQIYHLKGVIKVRTVESRNGITNTGNIIKTHPQNET